MRRNRVRLSESQLNRVIKESVRQMLSEIDWKTYANAAKKRSKTEKFPYNKTRELQNAAQKAFNRDHIKPNHEKGYAQYVYGKNKDGEDESMYGYFNVSPQFGDPYFRAHAGRNSMEGLHWDSDTGENGMSHNFDGDDVLGTGRDYYGTFNTNADEFFGDNNDAKEHWNAIKNELSDYANGNYEYQKGKGWQKKNGLDESIRRAIRKVLR